MASEQVQKKGGFHYAFLIVAAGIAITCIPCALVLSCAGIYFTPVSNYFGVPKASFTLYFSILNLAMMIMLPIGGKLMSKMDARAVLSAAVIIDGLTLIAMSFFTAVWQFYIAGVLLGIGTAPLIYLAVPSLINAWCKKKVGFFIGLCMAFTGIGGAIWSAVFTALRADGMDFHTIYLIWAVIAAVTSLPFTLLCVRSKPEDCGLQPYGAAAAAAAAGTAPKASGLSASRAMKTPTFYAACVFAGIINIAILIAMQFPSYTKTLTSAPFDVAVVGGLMTTVMMVGQALFKVILGGAADKSAKGALVFAFCAGVAGILLCWFGAGTELMLYAGAFIFGGCYATAVVLVPVVVRQSFGSREYSLIYSRVSTVFNLIAAFASMIWAWVQTSFGFNVVFITGLIMLVVILLLGLYVMQSAKKYKSEWTTD